MIKELWQPDPTANVSPASVDPAFCCSQHLVAPGTSRPMNTLQHVCALPILMMLAGCATAPSPAHRTIATSMRLCMPFETAWQRMIQIAAADADQITLAQKDSGLLAFQKRIPSNELGRYAHNTTGLLLDHALAHLCLVLSADGQQHVSVAVNCRIIVTGRSLADVFLSRNRQLALPSRGLLEKDFLERLPSPAQADDGRVSPQAFNNS